MNRLAASIIGMIVVVAVVWAFGCCQMTQYSGDGQLIDNGALAAKDRYVLNLGSINLKKQSLQTFQIVNLPEANFVMGIEISVASEDRVAIENQQVNAIVSLELSTSKGMTLFTMKAPMAAWTWSVPAGGHRAFIYGRGGPGTYFNADSKTEYTLAFNVLEPDRSQSTYTALLIAKSGGWK